MTRPRGRARASVSYLPEAVSPLSPDVLDGVPSGDPLGQFPQRARDSVEEPVNRRPPGRVVIVDDQGEALRVEGRLSTPQRGPQIGTVAGVLRGNVAARGSRGTAELEDHCVIIRGGRWPLI